MRPSHWRERHYPFGASADAIPGPDWMNWRTRHFPFGKFPSGVYAPPPGTFTPSLRFGKMPSGVAPPPPGTFTPSLRFGRSMYDIPDYGQKRTSLMGYGGIWSADFWSGFVVGSLVGIIFGADLPVLRRLGMR